MIQSKPTLPPTPTAEVYGPDALQLFPRHNRSTFLDMFGVQPPVWDKTKPIKRWFDTTIPAGIQVTYSVYNPSKQQFEELKMDGRDAAAINLPGTVVYPKAAIAPTVATIVSPSGRFPLSATLLSSREEAELLVREFGFGNYQISESEAFAGGPFSIDWNTEMRRAFVISSIQVPDNRYSVAALLRQRNANGVGAPGVWIVSSSTAPVWAPAAPGDTGEQDPRPEVAIPCRALGANERLKPNFLGSVYIYRTDLPNPFPDVLQGSGSFTTEDRNLLKQTAGGVQLLLATAKAASE